MLFGAAPAKATWPLFAPSSPIATGDQPGAIVAADFNQDGKLDLATADAGTSSLTILLGNGNGTFTAGARAALTQPAYEVQVTDLNNDGKRDIVAATKPFQRIVEPLLGNGDGTFTAAPPYSETGVTDIAAGDFDADGKQDLALTLAGSSSTFIRTLQGAGNGTFTVKSAFSIGGMRIISELITARVNADARSDLVYAGPSSQLSNGDFTFTAGALGPGPPRNRDVDVADVTDDGVPDVVELSLENGYLTTAAGAADGSFTLVGSALQLDADRGLVTRDIDADGVPDVVAPAKTGGGLVTARGQQSGTFVALTPANYAGDVNALATGDFDLDGDIDVADTANDAVVLFVQTQDTTAPTTTDDVSKDDYANPVTVSLIANDEPGGSGLSAAYYEKGTNPAAPTLSSTRYDSSAKPVLNDGELIRYFSVDRAGNAETVRASRRVRVDGTGSETVLITGPPPVTNNRAPEVAFASPSSNFARFECAVGTDPYAACTSPVVGPGATDGAYRVSVRAVSRAGVADPSPLIVDYVVDGTPPAAPSITGGPSVQVTQPTATFFFTSREDTTFACSIDGATGASCSSPFTAGPLANGDHTFAVRAIDAAGNQSTAATAGFTVAVPDVTATPTPTVTPTPGPT